MTNKQKAGVIFIAAVILVVTVLAWLQNLPN